MNRMVDKRRRHLKRKAHIRKRVSGTASRPRMTVFRSNYHMYVQVIDDMAGRTLASASTVEANIDSVVFDRNGYIYHGIVKGIADGARKAGIKF